MKRKHRIFLFSLVFFFAICTSGVFAALPQVGSATLIDNGEEYDQQTICFTGEAVGDILYRGEYAWINVCDANNSAMGIYVTAQQAKQIEVLGKYSVRGDRLEVIGTFHRSCMEHEGDMDIHGVQLKVVQRGETVPVQYPKWLPWTAAVGMITAVFLSAIAVRRIKCYGMSRRK